MNTIYKKRRKFCFRDEYNIIRRFKTQQEAVAAGGIAPDEEVQVSGVPYTVPAKDVDLPSAVDDAADVMSDYENGED